MPCLSAIVSPGSRSSGIRSRGGARPGRADDPDRTDGPPGGLSFDCPLARVESNWKVATMLNDRSLSRMLQAGPADRRSSARTSATDEVVIDWHMMPGLPGRYELVNESANGCLIQSTLPLLDGMTGRIRARLPRGDGGRVSVVVAWSRCIDGRYHVGLRFFAPC